MIKIISSFVVGGLLAGLIAWRMARTQKSRLIQRQRKWIERTRRAERLAEPGSLTSHLAHEIRNPLSTIKVNLQLLAEEIKRSLARANTDPPSDQPPPDPQQYKRQLRKIDTVTQEVQRVTNTLNEFLQYAGRMEMHPGRYDLNEILDGLIDFFEPQAQTQNICIRHSFSAQPLFCQVDRNLFRQTILNLFVNATQVMQTGGELMIKTEKQDSQSAIVVIIDTGPGVPPENQEKIFDPYFTTRPGGTGLGLPTCRRVIEEHHGHLELQSEPGKGSSFRITLPLAKET